MLTHVSSRSQYTARQNLRWLFILRNLMLLSESLLIVLSTYGLKIALPVQPLWLVVLLIGALNFYTSLRLQAEEPVTETEIFVQLVLDVVAIAALLYLTGGASNPIIWVFLLPVIISAIILPQSYAWYMVIITSSLYTVLMSFNVPLPAIEPHSPNVHLMVNEMSAEALRHAHALSDKRYFNLHIFGMWFGFVFSAGLVAFFVVELAIALRAQERSLAEAREKALRDERVVALGTLAASAAHDMGTPLGTIAIVAHELEQEFPLHRFPDLHEKTLIIKEQVERCKAALSVMSASAGELRAESGRVILLAEYIDEVIKQWRTHKATTKLNFAIALDTDTDAEARIIAERTLTHSLINILNNAAEATPPEKGVEFAASWTRQEALICIRDFGAGFAKEVLDFAGRQPLSSQKRGLGVGLFLSYSTIQRLGGKIHCYNHEAGGACVEITIPLLDAGQDDDKPEIGQTPFVAGG